MNRPFLKTLTYYFFFFKTCIIFYDFCQINKLSTNTNLMSCKMIQNNFFHFHEQTLGVIRPPLFTMGDGYRGLPAFLSNSFAGNARQELLIGLQHFKLLSEDEIQEAVKSWLTFQIKNTQ